MTKMTETARALGMTAILSVFISQYAGASLPSRWTVDMDHSNGSVEFRATGHPSSLKIVGKGSAPKGSLLVADTQVKGSLLFDLTSLDTGIEMRTHHMKEKYLETGKFHDAKLTITRMTLSQSLATEHFNLDSVPFAGKLSLHGVERPVSGTAKIEKNGKNVSFTAQFGLKISDYRIAVPSFAGMTVADDVQVSVTDSAPLLVSASSKMH